MLPEGFSPETRAWIEAYEREEREQMGRYASDAGGGDFKQAPQGNHVARCIALIDLGTHHDEYEGKPIVRNQVMVRWELPNEMEEFSGERKPMIVSKFYTNSLSEKANLRKDLESWRSRAFTIEELMKFDLMNILGKPCMLSVVHTEKGKAKVASVAALPKGFDCPPQFNQSVSFWIDEWDQAKFDKLPKFYQEQIMDSDEYKKSAGDWTPQSKVKTEDEDVPF